jgi:hypothetical protein
VAIGDAQTDFRTDLDADHIGLEKRLSAQRTAVLGTRQQRGKHDRARMPRHHRQHIVEVETMAEGAVHHRGKLRRRSHLGPEYRARAGGAGALEVTQERLRSLATRSRDNACDCIRGDLLCFVERLRRHIARIRFGNKTRDAFGQSQAHLTPLNAISDERAR